MPKKITYLLGAGASANALPTVKGFIDASGKKEDGLSESMMKLSEKLISKNRNRHENSTNIDSKYAETADDFIKELKDLSHFSNRFGSVDIYAKYLFHTNRAKLKELKKTLSNYFIYKQSFVGNFDTRYLAFLTSVLNEKGKFPDNIKIISWNYDSQVQIAASQYEDKSDFKNFLRSYPIDIDIDTKLLSLVQLNGVVGLYPLNEHKPQYFSGDITDINYFFKHMNEYDNHIHLLSFAWEKENDTESIKFLNERLEKAKYVIQKSDILVIIGYSFPFFNRGIDNELFKELKEGGLKKIYYQDPYSNGNFLKTNLI